MNGDVIVNSNSEINANATIADSQIASATVVTQEEIAANGSAIVSDEVSLDAQLALEDEIVVDGSMSTEEETIASGRLILPTVGAGENNVIEVIKVNGTELPVEDKTVDITVPTKTSELTNDSDFVEESELSRVAFTGSYRDLYDTPTIPDVPTKTSDLVNDSGFITRTVNNLTNYTRTNLLGSVALTNDYNDLDNKPEIPTVPTKTSDLTNDSGFITKNVDDLENYPKANEFAPVAFSGSYNDLSGTPTMTSVTVTQTQTSGTKIGSIKVDNVTTNLYAPSKVTATSQLNNDGSDGTSTYVEADELATVATSGNYNDLTNKPTMTTVTVTQVETTGTKIATIKVNNTTTDLFAPEGGSGSQIQSDWTQSDSTAVDYIKHKPALKTVATSGSYNDLTDKPTIPAAQIQSDWTQADNTKKDYIKNKPSLSTVATSGSYNDLTDKPTIPTQTTVTVTQIESTGTHIADITVNGTTTEIYAPEGGDTQIQSDWTQTDTTAKDYIKNKPTKLSDFTNDEGFIDNTVNNLTNYTLSSSLKAVATSGSYNDLTDKPTKLSDFTNDEGFIDNTVNNLTNYTLSSSLKAVATSGSYNDLTDKPTIPAAQIQSDWSQSDNTAKDYIKNKPNLATVATSGSYADLSNTPSIPSKTSDLSNDSGFITKSVNDLTNYTLSSNLATVATSGAYSDLSGTPTIPAAQIQSDWTQSDNTKVDYIKNKPSLATVATSGAYSDLSGTPTIPTATSDLNNDSGFITNSVNDLTNYTLSSNLATVATTGSYSDLTNTPTIPAAQVQSDWTQSDNTAVDYINNKPSLATVATSGDYDDLLNKPSIPAAQVQSDWTQSDSTAVDYINNKPSLSTVATSGSYNDLTDKPSIPAAQIQSDWNQSDNTAKDFIKNKPNLATVATSGSYNDLSNTPTIPAAQVQSDWTQSDNTAVDYIKNKPNLATVATSGSYADLTNTPSIPTKTSDLTNDGEGGSPVDPFVKESVLATVATSGSYNDLSNTPTIPDAVTVTQIQTTGTNIASITIGNTTTQLYAPSGGGGSSVQSDWNQTDPTADDYIKNKPSIPPAIATSTESLSTDTIAPDTMKSYSNGLTSATLTVSTDVTMLHEWAGTFTTGASQTSVTIAMSDNATIFWTSSPAGLITSTLYAFSVAGNSTVGYTGSIVPLIYT